MKMERSRKMPQKMTAGILATVLSSAVLAAGCEVVNPGPVADEYMTLPASQQGFVNGAMERLTRTVGWLTYNTGFAAREIFPGGQTGSYGQDIVVQAGAFGNWNQSGQSNTYGLAQQARWVAEEAIRQFSTRTDVPADVLTQAYLWAGYASRVLGEGWCIAVFDGGPEEPFTKYFERAEAHFTNAIAKAPNDNFKFAAYAGRAQARLWLGMAGDQPNNTALDGAIADARQVPTAYNFYLEMDFSKGGNTAQRNHVFWANASAPYRSYTVRFTYFDQYYTQTGDPRTPWGEFPVASDRLCVGSLQGYGRVPCTQQRKYLTQDDDIRLASGAEMRLLEAEALLAKGDANWQQAMTLINDLRTSYRSDHGDREALAPWPANSAAEAWAVLKRERGIELWLEGRRFSDLRRWQPLFGEGFTQQSWPRGANGGVQGHPELPDFAAVMNNPTNNIFTVNWRGRPRDQGGATFPRELCYNISTAERNTNPNFADTEDDEP